jgi:thiopeptide-type bacteriocin biosynthesis protein
MPKKFNVYPGAKAIFRTPKFPVNSSLNESLEELKSSIRLSSPEFFSLIKDVQPDKLNQLPESIRYTLWKYFNRAKYRATPFGDFASFGLCEVIDEQLTSLKFDKEQYNHEFEDWSAINKVQSTVNLENEVFLSNSSFYIFGDTIRYLIYDQDGFHLNDIEYWEPVKRVLLFCDHPRKTNEVSEFILQIPNFTIKPETLIADMVSSQLLISNRSPNIIGTDYFKRLEVAQQAGDPKYMLSERKITVGGIGKDVAHQVSEMVENLATILPQSQKKALNDFTIRFQKKFDAAEIPLLIALDPELGVGYDSLETPVDEDAFVTQFVRQEIEPKKQAQPTEQLKTEWVKMMANDSQAKYIIRLEDMPLTTEQGRLPNSFSVMFSIINDKIWIEQIGGATATALTGRFSHAGEEVQMFCQEISAAEQRANPDVAFFDVAYMSEGKVDNINRREAVYPSQVTILNFDLSADPLGLNDIMVSVNGGEIMLWSQKLNCRVVPRIASAYNYTRSDLSVFRFLCDLQHQGLQTNLSIDLMSESPGLPYYPRVEYRNMILSPARWLLDYDHLIKRWGYDLGPEGIRAYLQEKGVSRYFKCGNADQTLLFDRENDQDMWAFKLFLNKSKTSYAEETDVPVRGPLYDNSGDTYNGQVLLNLFHDEELYQSIIPQTKSLLPLPKVIPPGKDWLYFEIYTHVFRANELLLQEIKSFLNENSSDISYWFFIRYNDGGDHIRLRVRQKSPESSYKLVAALSKHLDGKINTGIISDLQIKTYRRETERYSKELMIQIEKHFGNDSNYVLSLLQDNFSTWDIYKFCERMVATLRMANLFTDLQFDTALMNISDSYNKEHRLQPDDYKKLNAEYKIYQAASAPTLSARQRVTFPRFEKSFTKVLLECEPNKRANLFGDLMHMHFNRLFSCNPRTHEMIFYYFQIKLRQQQKHFKKGLSKLIAQLD